MPFIKKDRRKIIDEFGIGLAKISKLLSRIEPGDRCYVFYKEMVRRWKENPCWATAHEIYREIAIRTSSGEDYDDNLIAEHLAWQVFFIKYVWAYEQKKIQENGDIE